MSNPAALVSGQGSALTRGRLRPRVSRTVILLGLTSLFTDISSEMVVTVLPLYLVYIGGFSPLAFGLIAGLYNGAVALVGLAGRFLGDRFRRHKEVAATGCSSWARRCLRSAPSCCSIVPARGSARPRGTR